MNTIDKGTAKYAVVGPDDRPLADTELAGFVRLADVPGETLIERLRTLEARRQAVPDSTL